MTTLETLIKARALIERPEHWGKGSPFYRSANSHCVMTAIDAVEKVFGSATNAFRKAIGCDCIVEWNDAPERTHAEVLDAFDRAIEAERAKGAN